MTDAERHGAPEVVGEDLDVVAPDASLLERVGDLQVQPGASQRCQAVEQRLAHERVAEAERARAGRLDEQALCGSRFEQVEALADVEVGGAGEERDLHVAAGRRRHRQHVDRRFRQPAEVPPDRVAHRRRHFTVDPLSLVEDAGQLDGVERVALRPLVDARRDLGRQPRGSERVE